MLSVHVFDAYYHLPQNALELQLAKQDVLPLDELLQLEGHEFEHQVDGLAFADHNLVELNHILVVLQLVEDHDFAHRSYWESICKGLHLDLLQRVLLVINLGSVDLAKRAFANDCLFFENVWCGHF